MTIPISTTEALPPQERTAISLVPVLALCTFITMVHGMVLAPLIPAISDDIGTSVALLGQVSAVSMLLAGALGLLAGPLIDRFGHRRTLTNSLVAISISAIGMAVAPGYVALLFAALIGAMGRTIAQPVAVVIAGERFAGDAQRQAVSRVMAGVSAAPIIGIPPLTVIASAFGWRTALASLAIGTIALVLLVQRFAGPNVASASESVSIQHVLRAYIPILHHRPTFGLIAATLVSNSSIWVMLTYLSVFYTDHHGYTTSQVGWLFSLIGLGMFIGNLAAGGRLGSYHLRAMVTMTRVIVGILIAILYMAPVSGTTGLVLLGAMSLTVGVGGVAGALLLLRESPASRATTLTLNTVVLNLGIAIGGMIGGLLLALADFATVGAGALVLSFAAACIVWSTRPPPGAVGLQQEQCVSNPTPIP